MQRLPATVGQSNPLHKSCLSGHGTQHSIFQTLTMARQWQPPGSLCRLRTCTMTTTTTILSTVPHHDSRYYQIYRMTWMEERCSLSSLEGEPLVKTRA